VRRPTKRNTWPYGSCSAASYWWVEVLFSRNALEFRG
jgi:hypothetical protein